MKEEAFLRVSVRGLGVARMRVDFPVLGKKAARKQKLSFVCYANQAVATDVLKSNSDKFDSL